MNVGNKSVITTFLIIYAMIESEEITVLGYFALHITSFPQRLKDLRNTTLFPVSYTHLNGRRKTSEQTYEEMLANMQSGVRHKPTSSVKL